MRSGSLARAARVVSVGRNAVWLAFEDESDLRVASLRKNVERLSLVPGDVVFGTLLADGRVLVERRAPRTFALGRTTQGGRAKTMAANIDGIAVVAAFARPPLHLAMIDELVAFAEIHAIAARLFFTKSDLADADAGVAPAAILALYRGLGYEAFAIDPRTGGGIAGVAAALAGHRTLLIGQSGVGKSSLFTALGGTADVGDVSKIGRGKQTTTTGCLLRTPGGFLIDSPGVGAFTLEGCTPAELALGFVEFGRRTARCRFADCVHRSEPGCAVIAAVAAGEIATTRYESYRAILGREAKA